MHIASALNSFTFSQWEIKEGERKNEDRQWQQRTTKATKQEKISQSQKANFTKGYWDIWTNFSCKKAIHTIDIPRSEWLSECLKNQEESFTSRTNSFSYVLRIYNVSASSCEYRIRISLRVRRISEEKREKKMSPRFRSTFLGVTLGWPKSRLCMKMFQYYQLAVLDIFTSHKKNREWVRSYYI